MTDKIWGFEESQMEKIDLWPYMYRLINDPLYSCLFKHHISITVLLPPCSHYKLLKIV